MCDNIIWPIFTYGIQAPLCQKTTPSLRAFSLWFYFSHILTFPLCPFLNMTMLLSDNLLNSCCTATLWTPALFSHYCPFSVVQRLEVTEKGCGCRHGIWKYEQWGGAEPEGVWAVCAETQHSTTAERLHCPAVHLQARKAHGLPQGVLWEAGKGLWLLCFLLLLLFFLSLLDRKWISIQLILSMINSIYLQTVSWLNQFVSFT